MNMAGVVAGPKSVTETPFEAIPADSAAASVGPVSLGSEPIYHRMLSASKFSQRLHLECCASLNRQMSCDGLTRLSLPIPSRHWHF